MRAAVRRPSKGWVLRLFLALHLAVSRAENTVLVGSTDPVRGIVGGDVILPCFLRPTSSAVEESVEWQRLDLEPKEVHLYRDHSDDYALQNPSYTGRTSLFHEELKNGNVSLKLTNVKRSDAGNYTCYIPTSGHQKTTIELYVGEDGTPSSSLQPTQPPLKDQSGKVGGAAPRPWLFTVETKDKEVVLKCEAEGLVYKPELVLLNSDGTILLADEPTERPMDSRGLVHIDTLFHCPEDCHQRVHLSSSTAGDRTHEGDTDSCSRQNVSGGMPLGMESWSCKRCYRRCCRWCCSFSVHAEKQHQQRPKIAPRRKSES